MADLTKEQKALQNAFVDFHANFLNDIAAAKDDAEKDEDSKVFKPLFDALDAVKEIKFEGDKDVNGKKFRPALIPTFIPAEFFKQPEAAKAPELAEEYQEEREKPADDAKQEDKDAYDTWKQDKEAAEKKLEADLKAFNDEKAVEARAKELKAQENFHTRLVNFVNKVFEKGVEIKPADLLYVLDEGRDDLVDRYATTETVNAEDEKTKETPIHRVVAMDDQDKAVELVKALAKAGADVNHLKGDDKVSPLEEAFKAGKNDVAVRLMISGAKWNYTVTRKVDGKDKKINPIFDTKDNKVLEERRNCVLKATMLGKALDRVNAKIEEWSQKGDSYKDWVDQYKAYKGEIEAEVKKDHKDHKTFAKALSDITMKYANNDKIQAADFRKVLLSVLAIIASVVTVFGGLAFISAKVRNNVFNTKAGIELYNQNDELQAQEAELEAVTAPSA